jgi:hypothetical protein
VESWGQAFDVMSRLWEGGTTKADFLGLTPLLSTPFTMVAALRLALDQDREGGGSGTKGTGRGKKGLDGRTAPVVVHLVGHEAVSKDQVRETR